MSAPTSQLPFPSIAKLAAVAVISLFLGLLLTSQSMSEPALLSGLNREANVRLAHEFFRRQTGHLPPGSMSLRALRVDQSVLTALRQSYQERTLQHLVTQQRLPVVSDEMVWLNGRLSISLSPDGELISYLNSDVPVSNQEPPAAAVAMLRARTFLDSNTSLWVLGLGSPQVQQVPGQPETEVRWEQPLVELPTVTRVVLVRLRGETVWHFLHKLETTASGGVSPFSSELIHSLLWLLLETILLIAAGGYLLKISRRHVILWRVPTVAAAVVGFGWLFILTASLLQSTQSIGIGIVEGTWSATSLALIGHVIYRLAGVVFDMAVIWVVCAALLHIEYDTQRSHTEVFRAILLLRRVPHLTILQRGLKGTGVGWLLLGFTGLARWLLSDLSPVNENINDNFLSLLNAWSPSLLVVGTLVNNTFDLGLVLVAFTWVLLVDWLHRPRWLALIVIPLLGSIHWRDSLSLVLPSPLDSPWLLLHQATVVLVLAATFERFGLWTTLCAVWVYQATGLAVIAATLPILKLSPWLPTLLVGFPFVAVTLAWRPPESELDRQPAPLKQFLEEQRQAQQLTLAAQIQMSFLPPAPPRLNGWDIAALSVPAREVGGDFYDFFVGPDSKLGIFAGDVSGKSVSGAMFTAVAITAFRSEAEEKELSCAAMLTRLNELLYPDMKRVRMFVAAAYVQLDLATGRFTVANAGFPVVGRWHGSSRERPYFELLEVFGLPLGSLRRATYNEYHSEQLYIANQGFLLLASDGIVEALNERGEPYGYKNLERLINDYIEARGHDNQVAQALCMAIISDVRRHMGEAVQADDMTVVVIRRVNPQELGPQSASNHQHSS
ncbi:MAG: PP2C family protein-serine/threonine phosphatase [Acidobacteriota bacterium]